MILTELRRIGIPKDKAEDKINSWNSLNITALPQSDIRSSIRSAYKDSKTYGCNSRLLEEFCKSLGGKKACHYYKQVPKKIRNYSEDDYINFGWQKALTSRECFILFYIIPFLERKRGFNPGSWLYVSCRELEEISGINKRYFSQEGKNILDKLAALDLIYYIPGKQHKWNKQAGRIRRVIPIPKCSQVKYQNVNTL